MMHHLSEAGEERESVKCLSVRCIEAARLIQQLISTSHE